MLQSDVNELCRWYSINQLQVNVLKCQIMSFSRRSSSYKYEGNDITLSRASSVHNMSMTFGGHLECVVTSAMRSLDFVMRHYADFRDMLCLNSLHDAYLRSRL